MVELFIPKDHDDLFMLFANQVKYMCVYRDRVGCSWGEGTV